ncbi:hypothetical protein GCM10012275_09930 [Longimycelium tulufanense]|uniref:DUF3558 domain-containing protein n=1 Tax=Longimycelium tulufanense TaxID=907463 RepID=A0A8J3CBA7_9PSEU|nr:DUF3558 domain-containing protein [Longimycelium tulufanense]GGM40963.1 hypothetical protein GCM10012275_09930 [Longimycelium tulufanense]
MTRWLGLFAAVLFVSGCATGVVGAPAPGSGDGTPGATRPRELRLDGVDPCSVLTADQLGRLGMDRPPAGRAGQEFESAACTFRGEGPAVVGVVLSTTRGLAAVGPDQLRGTRRELTVEGYPAVEVRIPDADRTEVCTLSVDVATGQMLDVVSRTEPTSTEPTSPRPDDDERCRRANEVTRMVLGNLPAK